MIAARLFACSGAKIAAADPVAAGRLCVELDSIGNKANVHIRFENVARIFHQHLSSRWLIFLRSLPTFTARTALPAEEKGGLMMKARSRGGATLLLSFP